MNTNDKIKEYIKKEKARKNKLYCKEYYKLNKDKLLEYGCGKVICEKCQREVMRNSMCKHKTSNICKKHSEILHNLNHENILI